MTTVNTLTINMNKVNDVWEPGYQPYSLNTTEVIDMLTRRPEVTEVVFSFRAIPQVADAEIRRLTQRTAKIAQATGGQLSEMVIDEPGYSYHWTMTR